jgi:hypothetical protein
VPYVGATRESERRDNLVIHIVQALFNFVKASVYGLKFLGVLRQSALDISQDPNNQIFGVLCHAPYSAATCTGSGCGFAV